MRQQYILSLAIDFAIYHYFGHIVHRDLKMYRHYYKNITITTNNISDRPFENFYLGGFFKPQGSPLKVPKGDL